MRAFPTNAKYHIIYADPPWTYNKIGRPLEGLTSYPTMTLRELKELPVPSIAAATSVLFMWSTNPLLNKAMELIEAWGFEYKTVFKVWCKRYPNGRVVNACGWWSRPSTELLLVATRGRGYMNWKQTHSEPQEFVGVQRRHSQKPDEIREAVRGFFEAPHLRRIELFARSECPGFDSWGLEVPGFFFTHTLTHTLTHTSRPGHNETTQKKSLPHTSQ
jgi:N6-adenosine-specific RNA methylase IME4